MKLVRGFFGFILGAVLGGGLVFIMAGFAKLFCWIADQYGPLAATAGVFALLGGLILAVACHEGINAK